MTRTDIHRPSAPEFDPEAYVCVGVWDLYPEPGFANPVAAQERLAVVTRLLDQGYRFGGGAGGGCGHCGARIRYAALMAHEDSKEMLYVGETCLSNRFEALTKAEFAALRKSAALNRERTAKAAKIEALVEAHPALAWLTYPAALESSFLEDVAWKFRKYGELSEKQIAAVERALVKDTERRERQEAREAEAAALRESGVRVPEGRVEIEGTVVSTRYMEPYAYGAAGTWKMLVVADEGWKVWATVCSSFYTAERNGVEKGDRVRFTATIKPSDDDALFGFASRPTKGEVL